MTRESTDADENQERGYEGSPHLEEPLEVGRVGFLHLLRCQRGGGDRCVAAFEVVDASVDGEIAEEIAHGEQRASNSPHLCSLIQE